jgi:methionine-R-sulfoxide reductase
MTRIHSPPSRASRLTVLLGFLAAVGVVAVSIFLSHAQQQKKITAKMNYRDAATPPDAQLRKQLTQEQYHVTREDGTEMAFQNSYWNNHRPGIYVDLISGEPLFSSNDKFDSGTGWPSFTKPISPERVVEKQDNKFGMVRREVRSQKSDSHLGHIFEDGPPPSGLRYCLNSASLKFIPVEKLQVEGYGEFLPLFGKVQTK